MKSKVFIIGVFAIVIAIGAIFVYGQNENIGKIALLMENVEALTSGETLPGKICYYKGKSKYEDRIPCTADYPNIGKCGSRITSWFSTESGQCYE